MVSKPLFARSLSTHHFCVVGSYPSSYILNHTGPSPVFDFARYTKHGPTCVGAMMSSSGVLEVWCHCMPIVPPASIGQALLAGCAAYGSHPQVISGSVTRGMGSSLTVGGCGLIQSPSSRGVPSSDIQLKYVCPTIT
jgi:hypothetical protein